MPKQWTKLILIITRFNHGGCYLTLQQKKAFWVSPNGCDYGIYVTNNGVIICLLSVHYKIILLNTILF